MMKNKYLVVSLLSLLSVCSLTGCNKGQEAAKATFINATEESRCGYVSDYSKVGNYVEGDVVQFTVNPYEDYSVSQVVIKNSNSTKVARELFEQNRYQVTLGAGKNELYVYYNIDLTKDYVDSFKLPISPEDYKTLTKMGNVTGSVSTFWSTRNHTDYADLRTTDTSDPDQKSTVLGGIEEMMTETNNPKDYFINYVDGDTTHFNTRNYGYSVKARYLGIDTPESTSAIEKWGKSASNFNKKCLSGAKHIIVHGQIEEQIGEDDNGKPYYRFKVETDGNQRNLLYVWYSNSTEEFPALDTYRCLNLEMVYNGYSFGTGSIKDMGEYFFDYFQKASKSAQGNEKHIYSERVDELYYYSTHEEPTPLTIEDIYNTTSSKGMTDSKYQDNYTFYRIEGYVSRKIGEAFYIQNKPSYKAGDKAVGLYVFTYTSTPIKVGMHVSVAGVLSEYGGTYQLQGITYSLLNPDYVKDTYILDDEKVYDMVPIEVTLQEFYTNLYDFVLVQISDVLYCHDATSEYQGEMEGYSEGGSEEINRYNQAYPFYNTNNKIVSYANLDSSETDIAYNPGNTGKYLRFQIDQDILVTCAGDTAYSPTFFFGGSYQYNHFGAEWLDATYKPGDSRHSATITKTFSRKKIKKLICISANYVSTSGKTSQYSAVITAPKDMLLENITD